MEYSYVRVCAFFLRIEKTDKMYSIHSQLQLKRDIGTKVTW